MPLSLSGDGQITGLVDTYVWDENTNLPLTTLTGLTTGSGTWSINTYLQVVAPANTHCRGFSAVAITSGDVHIVEAEVEMPASVLTNSSEHLTVGFAPSDTTGNIKGGIRGDGQAYLEDDAVAGYPLGAFTLPAAGTWLKIRVKWDVPSDVFSLYLDGLFRGSIINDQAGSAAGFKPFVSVYDNGGNTVRWRNFKQWSLTRFPSTAYPADPA